MPLIINRIVEHSSRLLVWKITEPIEFLQKDVVLNEKNQLRFNGMKSEMHQRAFLSVRKLMAEVGYYDADLFYDEFGKPNLKDGKHTSISHSHEFSAICVSDQTIGIDLEWAREKIIRIANKFTLSEQPFLNSSDPDYINQLTVIWGVKESIFKIRNEPGISFQNHITVHPFNVTDGKSVGNLHFNNVNANFDIYFEVIENFVLVYAFEQKSA